MTLVSFHESLSFSPRPTVCRRISKKIFSFFSFLFWEKWQTMSACRGATHTARSAFKMTSPRYERNRIFSIPRHADVSCGVNGESACSVTEVLCRVISVILVCVFWFHRTHAAPLLPQEKAIKQAYRKAGMNKTFVRTYQVYQVKRIILLTMLLKRQQRSSGTRTRIQTSQTVNTSHAIPRLSRMLMSVSEDVPL